MCSDSECTIVKVESTCPALGQKVACGFQRPRRGPSAGGAADCTYRPSLLEAASPLGGGGVRMGGQCLPSFPNLRTVAEAEGAQLMNLSRKGVESVLFSKAAQRSPCRSVVRQHGGQRFLQEAWLP